MTRCELDVQTVQNQKYKSERFKLKPESNAEIQRLYSMPIASFIASANDKKVDRNDSEGGNCAKIEFSLL